MQNTQIEVYRRNATDIEAQASGVMIKTEEDLSRASDLIKKSKETQKLVETEKEKFTEPAKAIIAEAKSKYDPIIDIFKRVEKILKEKATTYIVDKNLKIAEEEARIAKQAESGRIKESTAIKKIEALPEQKKSAQGEGSSLRVSMIDDIEITDEKLIPREYLIPDLKKIKAAVLTLRVEVPGVKIIQKPKTSSY